MLKWLHGGISAVTGLAEPEYGTDYISSATSRATEQKIQPFREATRDDLEWLAADHTNVETATFYFSDLETGILGFAQIIHSNIVGLHTQAQFTFRIFDSHNPDDLNLWTSTKLENFRIQDTNFYADGVSVELNEESNEYHFVSEVNKRSLVDIYVTKLVAGCKVGDDPVTYYGDNIEQPWGTMRHIFWPRNAVCGTIKVRKGGNDVPSERDGNSAEEKGEHKDETLEDVSELEEQVIEFTKEKPALSLYILAFQGMKPHHASKSWNFLNFQSKTHSAVLIEFTTPKSYANTRVSVGIVTNESEVLSLTIDNDFKHLNAQIDEEIGWNVPKALSVKLSGYKSTVPDEKIAQEQVEQGKDTFEAVVESPLNKLVERVDVMNEIPNFVKNIVSGIAGTKPYIYQFADDTDFTLSLNGEKYKGLGWTEVTFISESDIVTEESYKED